MCLKFTLFYVLFTYLTHCFIVDHFFKCLKVLRIYVLWIGVMQEIPFDSCVMRVESLTSKRCCFPGLQRQVLRVLDQNRQLVFVRYAFIELSIIFLREIS